MLSCTTVGCITLSDSCRRACYSTSWLQRDTPNGGEAHTHPEPSRPADKRYSLVDMHGGSGKSMRHNKQRVLVTGGAGFVGSFLCERLLEEGYHVICVDDFHTGRQENVSHLTGRMDFEFVRHDITSPLKVQVDQIYNLACPASPVHYQQDPVRTTKVNVLGSINMLDLATSLGAKILQASTSEVY